VSVSSPDTPPHSAASATREDEWLWGWDPTPGIVSVWAEADGRATVWRRIAETGVLVREEARYRPWLLLGRMDARPAPVYRS
jgi:DNA polymerase I